MHSGRGDSARFPCSPHITMQQRCLRMSCPRPDNAAQVTQEVCRRKYYLAARSHWSQHMSHVPCQTSVQAHACPIQALPNKFYFRYTQHSRPELVAGSNVPLRVSLLGFGNSLMGDFIDFITTGEQSLIHLATSVRWKNPKFLKRCVHSCLFSDDLILKFEELADFPVDDYFDASPRKRKLLSHLR